MQKVIIILGMQRSGTSCLAGILEGAGVNLGNVSTYNLYNQKGNRENIKIMKLHDALLQYNNGSWDDPPTSIKWPYHLKVERDRILREYKDYSTWGFKDPRTVLALDGWLEVLPGVSFAATFRHPFLVAQSLHTRDKFPYSKSYSIWKAYNEKLLFYYEKFNFPVISYDLPKKSYKKKMKDLLKRLDIEANSSAFEFYDKSLKHHDDISDPGIPADVMEMFEELNRVAL